MAQVRANLTTYFIFVDVFSKEGKLLDARPLEYDMDVTPYHSARIGIVHEPEMGLSNQTLRRRFFPDLLPISLEVNPGWSSFETLDSSVTYVMLFRDRRHAGILLANQLQAYRGDHHAVVLALPRGGVVVGHEVSLALHLPLDVFITRKIAAPESPEYAVGAVSETGAVYLNREAVRAMQLSQEDLDGLIAAGIRWRKRKDDDD